ncbi:hypothetical protein NPX13_g1133 [Xylaria arbuscula]|uniref:Uncharacterized protein n=1 Tax=Xylaria arbuscula TaxID=114810 RepID=A0A9W8TS16_9PEZI|nr:hypothetical protein NPX13_g1133 [Xylaria arbuscula]
MTGLHGGEEESDRGCHGVALRKAFVSNSPSSVTSCEHSDMHSAGPSASEAAIDFRITSEYPHVTYGAYREVADVSVSLAATRPVPGRPATEPTLEGRNGKHTSE